MRRSRRYRRRGHVVTSLGDALFVFKIILLLLVHRRLCKRVQAATQVKDTTSNIVDGARRWNSAEVVDPSNRVWASEVPSSRRARLHSRDKRRELPLEREISSRNRVEEDGTYQMRNKTFSRRRQGGGITSVGQRVLESGGFVKESLVLCG
jgi:hypothetical protein